MMPTSPSSPLRFRTAGFPQYGSKAGVSDGAFPISARPSRRPVCLRPSCSPLASSYTPYCARGRCALEHRRASGLSRSTPGALAPVRVILSRSINAYPAPSAPLAGTSRLHRLATYTGCPRCAHAPRRPASGSVLSLCIPSRHAVLYDRGESIGCLCPVPSPMTLAFTKASTVRHSRVPPSSASDGTLIFAASLVRSSLRPVELLASLADLTGYYSQPTEAFTPGLSTARSPFPPPGITTVATEQVPPAGLSPTGTSASIAAPNPSTCDSFIHNNSPVYPGAQGESFRLKEKLKAGLLKPKFEIPADS
jgi:hypothetical protein